MKGIGKIFFSFLFFSFLFSPNVLAEESDVEVFATVNKNELSLGDRVQLTISVSSSKSVTVEPPKLPDLRSFDFLNSWTSTEARSEFVGGSFKNTRTQKFHYLLEPKKKGSIKIDAFQVTVGGDVWSTEPIELKVFASNDPNYEPTDGSSRQKDFVDNFGKSPGGLFSDFFGDTSPPKPPSKDDFFIQAFYNKKTVFEGELLLVSWFIYTKESIGDIDVLSYPSFKGFWKEDIEQATRLNLKNEVINGVIYRKAKIATYALFPISPGRAVIDSYTVEALLVRPSSFVFGRGRSYRVKKSSQPIEIEVLPLPEENKPEGFSQAVGKFSILSKLDAEEVSVDQPVSLNIRYQGYGNAKLMDLPSNIRFPEHIEHYDTRTESKFFKNANSYKNFELILIPRKEGEFEIPSFALSAFNPETKEYYSESTPILKLKVLSSKNQSKISSLPFQEKSSNKEDVELKKDPFSSPSLKWKKPFYSFDLRLQWFHWVFIYGALLLLFIGMKIDRLLKRGTQSVFKKTLNLSLKKIKSSAKKKDFRNVGVYGTNTIYYVLGYISGQGGAHLKIGELLNKTPPSFRQRIEVPIKELMKKFEVLSFAPKELMGELKDEKEILKVIQDMEGMLKVLTQEILKKKDTHFFSSKNKISLFLFFFLNVFPFYLSYASTVYPLKISIQDEWNVPRWLPGESEKIGIEKIKDQKIRKLYLIKRNLEEGKYLACLKHVQQLELKILRPWLRAIELECAKKNVMESKKNKTSFKVLKERLKTLSETLLKFKKASQGFSGQGRLPKFFYRDYIEALIFYVREAVGNQRDLKSLSAFNQSFIYELENLEPKMSASQKADFFFLMALLLVGEEKIFGARDYLIKSLNIKNSKLVQKELERVLKKIKKTRGLSSEMNQRSFKKGDKKITLKSFETGKSEKWVSVQRAMSREDEIYFKVQRAFKRGQTIKAIQEGVKLLRFYPWGKRNQATSDRVFKLYLRLTKKKFKNSSLKNQAFKQMKKVNGEILYSWAFRFYKMHFYNEAYLFGEEGFEKLKGRANPSNVLKVLAKSAFYLGDFAKADFYFKKLFFEHSGTPEAKEALFLFSLIKFKSRNYQLASIYLKQLVDLNSAYKLEAHYWLWRSLQKLMDQRANQVALILSKNYPLTYYGLRARAELNNGFLKLDTKDSAFSPPIEVQFWMTKTQRQSWERFKLFLLSGWFLEAREELEILSINPKNQQEKVIWAKFWGLSFDYRRAIALLREAFNEDKSLLKLSVLRYSYPGEFKDLIYKESQKNNVDPLLVQSVIRQESSFQTFARSPKNAMGLMQLMPITAWEQARLLKKKIRSKEDFFIPSINISFGTHYLKRMIRAFNGHVPLALAAYNVGIGNIRMWKKNRADLQSIEKNHSALFEDETWIDEMPWEETRFYVKSVLRDFLIYNILEKSEFQWKPNFWSKAKRSVL